jgi:hypothetical protein
MDRGLSLISATIRRIPENPWSIWSDLERESRHRQFENLANSFLDFITHLE